MPYISFLSFLPPCSNIIFILGTCQNSQHYPLHLQEQKVYPHKDKILEWNLHSFEKLNDREWNGQTELWIVIKLTINIHFQIGKGVIARHYHVLQIILNFLNFLRFITHIIICIYNIVHNTVYCTSWSVTLYYFIMQYTLYYFIMQYDS